MPLETTIDEIKYYPRTNSDSYGNEVVIVRDESPNLIDEVSGTEIYLGWSKSGSATSDSVWKIKRIKQVGTIWSQQYPDGYMTYNYKWDDRIVLNYK